MKNQLHAFLPPSAPHPELRSTPAGAGELSSVERSELASSDQTTFPADLSVLSTDELLMLSSRFFRQLDRKHPVRDAIVQYYAVARELEGREEADLDGEEQNRLGA
jgi:hypothetical protein